MVGLQFTTMEKNQRLYRIWNGMKQRCNNPRHPAARWYHNKGIRVCDQWENSFGAFQDWALSNGYFAEGSIDRIDPSRGYSPDNCRWITIDENRRRANPKGVKKARYRIVFRPQNTEERIVNLLNMISEAKGKEYTEGLVDGINMMTPRAETREQLLEAINFFANRLPDDQLKMVKGFCRGLYLAPRKTTEEG